MSKQIGTPVETATVRFFQKNGWPHCERRALAGIDDKGDLTGIPGLCVEVKGGKAAENASDGQVRKWLAETERERQAAKADIGILVMKRKGVGLTRAGEWWAVLDLGVLADLVYERTDGEPAYQQIGTPARVHLANLLPVLREAGYGEPLP